MFNWYHLTFCGLLHKTTLSNSLYGELPFYYVHLTEKNAVRSYSPAVNLSFCEGHFVQFLLQLFYSGADCPLWLFQMKV